MKLSARSNLGGRIVGVTRGCHLGHARGAGRLGVIKASDVMIAID